MKMYISEKGQGLVEFIVAVVAMILFLLLLIQFVKLIFGDCTVIDPFCY